MDVRAVSALLAGVLIVAIGTSVLLRSRKDKIYTAFTAFTFTVSAWQVFSFLDAATARPLMRWLALWAAATIPPTAIRFFRVFLAQPSIGGPKRGPRVTLAWTLIAYSALIYSAVVTPIVDKLWFTLPFGAYVFGGLYRCVWDLFRQYRSTAKAGERTRIRYLTAGGFIATTLALTDVLPRFGVAWPALGNVLGILYLYFLSQTLFRARLIDVNELIGKMAVLGTLVILLSAVYSLLLYWIGGGQEGLYLLNALVASFVILILFEPVRSRLESGIHRWLMRQRYELRGRLEAVRRDLPGVVDIADMVTRIMAALEESHRVTDASIYLLDADGAGYDRASFLGAEPAERLDANSDRALLDRLRQGYIDTEVLRAAPAREVDRATHAANQALITRATELAGTLLVPFLGSAETEQGPWLLGLLCLRDDRADGAFDAEDVEVFRQLAGAASQVIESNQAYERIKERDRLAALGEMAAGLAHEIRNPLGAIKGAAQLLMPTSPEASETKELLEIIVEETNRLNAVVTRFLDYTRAERPAATETAKVDLNLLVRKTAQVLAQTDEAKPVDVRLRIDDLLPRVTGDPESLMQVFLNLALNACQAMPHGGTLEITTTRRRRSRLGYGQFAEVRFRDTGVGIARDKLKKLFIPFYTTKSKGTGLGLAISQRIINHHGGTIEVRSLPGQGSTFSVFLPAAEPVAAVTDPHKDITDTARIYAANLSRNKPSTDPPAPSDNPNAHDAGTPGTTAAAPQVPQ